MVKFFRVISIVALLGWGTLLIGIYKFSDNPSHSQPSGRELFLALAPLAYIGFCFLSTFLPGRAFLVVGLVAHLMIMPTVIAVLRSGSANLTADAVIAVIVYTGMWVGTYLRRREKHEALAGIWRMGVFVVVFPVSALFGSVLRSFIGVPEWGPSLDPPWYWIRQDFFTGIGFLVGMILMLTLLACTWRRYRASNDMVLGATLIMMLPKIIGTAVIFRRCPSFFDYAGAISYWPTLHSYIDDPFRSYSLYGGAAIAQHGHLAQHALAPSPATGMIRSREQLLPRFRARLSNFPM